ncbi:MAG: efflux RND transporter periplasmic adaptor subunit, partial [Planctomycetaceae bacterium]|nr:efflux RND transporter periplasmic adaptor subunit [Planctomycetaceae bacterium]
ISTFVEEQAKTRLPKIYRITMPLEGRVLPIDLTAGDPVAKGQVVAELETSDLATAVEEGKARVTQLEKRIIENDDARLERNALRQFDKFLESMDHTVRSAKEQTTASKAKVEFAEAEFQRQKNLKEKNVSSDREFAEAELLLKESHVDYAKDNLTLSSLESIRSAMTIGRETIEKYIEKKSLQHEVLQQELNEAKLQLDQLERNLARGVLVSEIDGTVLERHISNKTMLGPGELLLEIGDLNQLEVEAEILSEDAVIMRRKMPVEIVGPSIGTPPLTGTVKRIEPQGFTKISSLGVEQQRVRVIIDFDSGELADLKNRGRELGADYRVRVRIFTGQKSNTISIPRSALFRGSQGNWQVFVVRDGKAHRVEVEVGLLNDFRAEILKGVQADEQVIIAPEASLEDGEKVTPRIVPDLAESSY